MPIIMQFLAPYLFRIIIGASIAALLGGAFLYAKVHYENIGYAKAIHAIAAKDERAIEHVSAAKKKVDECFNSGRNWDASRGVCS